MRHSPLLFRAVVTWRVMDKLQLTGRNLCRVFNFLSEHFWCYQVKLPNLKLKTGPKQLLGSFPLVIAFNGRDPRFNRLGRSKHQKQPFCVSNRKKKQFEPFHFRRENGGVSPCRQSRLSTSRTMPRAVGKFWQSARGGSTVVEHFVTNPQIEGIGMIFQ
jgi:hypothetical protein